MTKPVTEGAIIKAAAHPHASTTGVKGHQGNQHHVQPPRVHRFAKASDRLGDAKAVGKKNIGSAPLAEPQPVVRERVEHREIDLFAERPGVLSHGLQIKLTISTEVNGYGPSFEERTPGRDSALNHQAVKPLLPIRQVTPPAPGLTPQSVDVAGDGNQETPPAGAVADLCP